MYDIASIGTRKQTFALAQLEKTFLVHELAFLIFSRIIQMVRDIGQSPVPISSLDIRTVGEGK